MTPLPIPDSLRNLREEQSYRICSPARVEVASLLKQKQDWFFVTQQTLKITGRWTHPVTVYRVHLVSLIDAAICRVAMDWWHYAVDRKPKSRSEGSISWFFACGARGAQRHITLHESSNITYSRKLLPLCPSDVKLKFVTSKAKTNFSASHQPPCQEKEQKGCLARVPRALWVIRASQETKRSPSRGVQGQGFSSL